MRRRAKVGLFAVAGLVAIEAATFAVSPVGADALSGDRSAGSFSWSSPLVASRSSRAISVQADVEGRDDDIGCRPKALPHVRETSARVTIRIEIIDRPLPAGTGCAAVAVSRLAVAVRLREPIGDRTVVDGRGEREHAVLVADQQPTIRDVPRLFARRATSWDEAGRRVGQWWRWQAHGQAAQIDLDFGPARSPAQLGLPADAARRARVGTATATIWRQRDADTTNTTVLWTPSRGRTFHLQVFDQSADPMSREEVLQLARSVR